MTYHAEVAKEYLREAFHSGALDITGSYESVRGFVQIFAGEMDALVAIAKPTTESTHHYRMWLERITGRRRCGATE